MIDEQNTNTTNPHYFGWTKFIIPGSIIIAGALISLAIIYSNNGFGKLGGVANIEDSLSVPKTVSENDDAYIGDKDAPVVIIEFSDFQCPFCRSFWRDTLPLIKSEYIDTGKAKFVYRDFPLSFHSAAMPAAQAAECAKEQGKFWEMHDKIFSEQDKLGLGTVQFNINDLKKWAVETGVNVGKFNSCLDSQKYNDEVNQDLSDGQAAGVSGTPGFFLNGKSVIGAQPFSVFKTIIDKELGK